MRVRNLALACVAVVAYAIPAHADVILDYHLSTFVPANPGTVPPASQIPSTDALGPLIAGNSAANPLMLSQGQTIFLQICIQANATPPTMISPDNQANWTPSAGGSGNTMTTFAFGMNYPLSIVTQPYNPPSPPALNQNFSNARSQSGNQPDGTTPGYVFATGHPITFTNYNMGQTAITGLDLGAGLGTGTTVSGGVNLLSDTCIAVMKISAGMTAGTGQISLFDLNTAESAAGFGLLDGTNLDTLIFSAAHGGQNSFPLFIQVAAVPEPSSMCLAGLAIAGFGWRKLRRKAKVGVAA
jgi:hypothetical protein